MLERSELITTAAEAVAYYRAKLAGARTVTVQRASGEAQRLNVVFEADGTHVFAVAVKPGEPVPDAFSAVERKIPSGGGSFRIEVRRFNCARARLMDEILRALSLFSVAVPEAGGRPGHQKTIVYGPALASGERMRVVLRPGPGDARTCVSAYPVSAGEWLTACRLKRARFP